MANNEQFKVGLELTSRIFQRAYISFLFYSGQLEQRQRKAFKEGNANWRILRYQHVCNPERLAYPITRTSYVRPKAFEQQVRYLFDHCNVIPLEELISKFKHGQEIENKTVAITFDGGFSDLYHEAFPRLQNFGLPATLFIPTGFIGTHNLFWTDKILTTFMIMKELNYEFPNLPQFDEDFVERLFALDPSKEVTLAKAAFTITEMKKMSPEVRFEILAELGPILEDEGGIPLTETFLTWHQVHEMAAANFSIGSMGNGHKYFDELGAEELNQDLSASTAIFEEAKLEIIKSIACPEGRFNKISRKVLGEAGFDNILGIGSYAEPSFDSNNAAVIGRNDVFQDVSFCKEYFSYFLW